MKWTKFKKIFLTFNIFAPLILSACGPINNYQSSNPIVVNPVVVANPTPKPNQAKPAPANPSTPLSPQTPPVSKNPNNHTPPNVANEPTDSETEAANPNPINQLSEAEIQQQIATSPMPILNWLKYNEDSETNNPEKIAIPHYTQENKTVLDFFLRRTIALSFVSKRNYGDQATRSGSGTGTILGKASTDPKSLEYYVATNIHVSNDMINNNPYETIVGYQFAINPLFNKYYDTQNFPSKKVLNNEDPQTPLNINSNFWFFKNQDDIHTVGLTKDFYNFTRSTKDDGTNDRLFYQATNIQINPYNPNSSSQLAADFSVAKIDFTSARNKYLNDQSPKGLIFHKFLKSLETLPDAKFAWTTPESTAAGYLAGFPTIWNNSQGLHGMQYVNFAVNNPQSEEVPLPTPFGTLKVNKDNWLKTSYETPTNNLYATNLVIGPGSSGSMFINQQGEIAGIYWGILSIKNIQGRRTFDGNSEGQITKLRVDKTYDLIGGTTTKATTPHVHSFCDVINQKYSQNKTLRVPDFCN